MTALRPLLPYALAFAAGAMIFVVVEVPRSRSGRPRRPRGPGTIVDFAAMMTVDVALG